MRPGVQIACGRPIHESAPGLHAKRPWSQVEKMDGSTQIDDHLGDNRTEIRLGNQATGYVPKVDFDDATQQRISQLQQEIGNTRIAQQREITAQAEARANETIADSVSKNPDVLVSRCLDEQREMIEKGQAIPVGGLGCWPDSPRTPVIVGQK